MSPMEFESSVYGDCISKKYRDSKEGMVNPIEIGLIVHFIGFECCRTWTGSRQQLKQTGFEGNVASRLQARHLIDSDQSNCDENRGTVRPGPGAPWAAHTTHGARIPKTCYGAHHHLA